MGEVKFIGCVEHYNGHISQLRVFDGSTWVTKTREEVVADILGSSAPTYYTYYVSPSTGKNEVGAKVEVIEVNYTKFLRTDRDKTPRDNLDWLPGLAACPF